LDSTSRDDAEQVTQANAWAQVNVADLLTGAALAIGAGTPTDVGRSWALPTAHPDPIVLAGGIPDADTLPVQELRDALDQVLATDARDALEYGGRVGYDGLREAMAERLSRTEGIPMAMDNLLFNNGSSGTIDNICRAFIEPGDVIITERPSYSGSIRTMRGYQAQIVDVEMDDEGISPDGVRDAINAVESEGGRVKFLYTIADFHNPTGVTMSPSRRAELVELCAAHRIIILEDAAYAELYFGAEPVPSIYSIAEGEGVLKLGSFSKSLATGLRVGWVQGRPDFVESISRMRFDMGSNPLMLRALADIVSSGKFDSHLDKMRPIYEEKSRVLANSLAEHCEPYLRFSEPSGGFFQWVESTGVPARKVLNKGAEEGLIMPVGSVFYRRGEEQDTTHIRMAFSNAPLDKLNEVGERLNRAFRSAVAD
jgi:2-aminoadipate transaminase